MGIVAGAACTIATGGGGAVLCGMAAGAIAGAVTNLWASKVTHTQQFSWTSLGLDIVLGGISGAIGGAVVKGVKVLAQTEAGAAAKTALAGVGKALAGRAGTALRAATNKVTKLASTTAKTALQSSAGGATDTAEAAADAALAAGRTTGAAAEFRVGGRVFTDVSTGGAPRVLNGAVQEALDAVPSPPLPRGGTVPAPKWAA